MKKLLGLMCLFTILASREVQPKHDDKHHNDGQGVTTEKIKNHHGKYIGNAVTTAPIKGHHGKHSAQGVTTAPVKDKQ